MNKVITFMLTLTMVIAILFLTGCSGSSSYSGTSYYQSYHDPYPNWGRRTVYIRDDDHHHKPKPPSSRPPNVRPPGSRPPNIGRPPNRPSRPVNRPAARRR